MRSFDGRKVALAAAAGLALGASACKGGAETGTSTSPVTAGSTPKGDKACCKGLNDCKGKGGCAVEGKHDCAGKNDCKAQGGCSMHCPK